MMYIDALCRGLDDMPTVSDGTRAYVLSLLEHNGLDAVLAQLKICDPLYWEQVDRSNTRRWSMPSRYASKPEHRIHRFAQAVWPSGRSTSSNSP